MKKKQSIIVRRVCKNRHGMQHMLPSTRVFSPQKTFQQSNPPPSHADSRVR